MFEAGTAGTAGAVAGALRIRNPCGRCSSRPKEVCQRSAIGLCHVEPLIFEGTQLKVRVPCWRIRWSLIGGGRGDVQMAGQFCEPHFAKLVG